MLMTISDQPTLDVVASLPRETLRRILLKGSIHMIKCLIMAHPRLLGPAFLDVLATSVRPQTLRTLIDEVSRGSVLTPFQISAAEQELFKLISRDRLLQLK